jgi:hypothetical protein
MQTFKTRARLFLRRLPTPCQCEEAWQDRFIHFQNSQSSRLALAWLILAFLGMGLRAAIDSMIHPPIIERIRLTAAYTNAVFHAIWPHVTECARVLNLPTPSANQVAEFRCFNESPVAGLIMLTNFHVFEFSRGHIWLYDSDHAFFGLQDFSQVSQFYGQLNITKEQAIAKARHYVQELGYDLNNVYLDQPPTKVTGPVGKGKKLVPHFRIEWDWPEGTADIEVNGTSGGIENAVLHKSLFNRPDPVLAVKPELTDVTVNWWKENGVSEEYARLLTQAVLPQIQEFARKLDLTVQMPLSMESVNHWIAHKKSDWDGPFNPAFESVYLEVFLKDGNAFCLCNGYVVEFHAADSTEWAKTLPPREKLSGKWNMTDKEAVKFARNSLEKLGHTLKDFHAHEPPSRLARKVPFGNFIVPRILIGWGKYSNGMAEFEIDTNKKEIKYLRLILPKINRPWPDVGVPLQ